MCKIKNDNIVEINEDLNNAINNYDIIHCWQEIFWLTKEDEIMHDIVISTTIKAISLVKYIAMSCDEVISVDNQSWISLHAYVI